VKAVAQFVVAWAGITAVSLGVLVLAKVSMLAAWLVLALIYGVAIFGLFRLRGTE